MVPFNLSGQINARGRQLLFWSAMCIKLLKAVKHQFTIFKFKIIKYCKYFTTSMEDVPIFLGNLGLIYFVAVALGQEMDQKADSLIRTAFWKKILCTLYDTLGILHIYNIKSCFRIIFKHLFQFFCCNKNTIFRKSEIFYLTHFFLVCIHPLFRYQTQIFFDIDKGSCQRSQDPTDSLAIIVDV